MTIYDMNKLLRESGYTMIKAYKFHEIWEKNGYQLTIPTVNDRIPDLVVRKIKLQMKVVK